MQSAVSRVGRSFPGLRRCWESVRHMFDQSPAQNKLSCMQKASRSGKAWALAKGEILYFSI